MNEPESGAPITSPAWQTPVLVPLLDANDAAGKANVFPQESGPLTSAPS